MAVDSADAPLEAPRLPINQTLRGSDRSFLLLTFKAAGEKPMYLCENFGVVCTKLLKPRDFDHVFQVVTCLPA